MIRRFYLAQIALGEKIPDKAGATKRASARRNLVIFYERKEKYETMMKEIEVLLTELKIMKEYGHMESLYMKIFDAEYTTVE